MLDFLSENLATIIISLVLIVVCTLIILKMRRNKKQGKTSCGCGCSGCAMKNMCHSEKTKSSENPTNERKTTKNITTL